MKKRTSENRTNQELGLGSIICVIEVLQHSFDDAQAQGKVLPREKFYPEKKSTPEKVYPGKNPQFWSNQADIRET